jgi:hypothetical protein
MDLIFPVHQLWIQLFATHVLLSLWLSMATKKIAAFINKIVEKFNFNKISYRAYFPVYAGYQIQAHS